MSSPVTEKIYLEEQSNSFGYYLLRQPVPAQVIDRYFLTIQDLSVHLSDQDTKLLEFITKHRWSIGFIDSGLALGRPDSEVRHRLFIMFALLEATPDFHDYFLPKKLHFMYFFIVIYTGFKALIKAFVGVLFVNLITLWA